MKQPRYRAAIRAGRISELPSSQLHAIYGRFRRLWEDQGELSSRQEWLWERVSEELHRRWHRARPMARCHCEICLTCAEVLE